MYGGEGGRASGLYAGEGRGGLGLPSLEPFTRRRSGPAALGLWEPPLPPPYCCPYPCPYCTLPLTRHIQGPPTALGDTAGWGGARNLLWGGVPFGPFDAPTVHWNSLAYQHFANRCGFWSRGLSAPLMGPSHTLLIRHGRVSLFGFFELN